MNQWKEKLPELCNGYALCDIYNVDETGIFFRALPSKSLIRHGEQQSGTKVNKEHFTAVVCANAMGDKLKLWIIGKSKCPHSFPKYTSELEHHIIYRSNAKGWMTRDIFIEFLNKLNNKMKLQCRKILLLLDNCPSHLHVTLSNVE